MTGKQPNIERRGLLLVLSSPSGAGKTSLARALLDGDDSIRLSVSVTTRKPRPGEVEGKDYYFVDDARFNAMKEEDKLLEWARVFDNYYGTPRAPIEDAIAGGRDVLFDIDWQGTQQLYERKRADVVSVFVLPPTAEELRARLERRAEDSDEVIARRLRNAAAEIPHWVEYDYVLVNRDLQKSYRRLRAILTAERLKRVHHPEIESFVAGLLADLGRITG
jgi:guanylate kinase